MSKSRSRDASPVRKSKSKDESSSDVSETSFKNTRLVYPKPDGTKMTLVVNIRAEHVDNTYSVVIPSHRITQEEYDRILGWSYSENVFVDYFCSFNDEGQPQLQWPYEAKDRDSSLPFFPTTNVESKIHHELWQRLCDKIPKHEPIFITGPAHLLYVSTFC